MPITIEELKKRFRFQNVTPYGECVIVPGSEFDPDWEDELSSQGCELHFVEIAGKPVMLVQKGKDQEEEDNEEPVIKSPEKPPVEEPAKQATQWTEKDEKLLISLWNIKVKVSAIRAKFPGRSERILRYHVRALQLQGKIASRWKKHKVQQPPKSYSIKRWSDKEKDLLVKLWKENVTVSKIAENFPNRTKHAVAMLIDRLQAAGKIQTRVPGWKWKTAEEPKAPKREKVEKKEDSKKTDEIPTRLPTERPALTALPTEVPTSIPTEIPTHALTQQTERLVYFKAYCRKCRDERTVEDAEVWICCPVCGGPLIIWNVEVHE
jgi:hypothetical protein